MSVPTPPRALTWEDTKPYKFIVYLLGGIAALVASVITDGITRAEWAQLLLAAGTVAATWLTSNLPTYPRIKEWTTAMLTLVNVGVSWLTGAEITGPEWVNIVILLLAALGVFIVPNPPKNDGVPNDRGAGELVAILMTAAGVFLGLLAFAILRALGADIGVG